MIVATEKLVRIGGASGFWGDSELGLPQLLESGRVDYVVFDYLAEMTMSILAGTRRKDSRLGYATDFVTTFCENAHAIVSSGVRLVANAGGVNPQGCVEALRNAAAQLKVKIKIAFVEGDDAMHLLPSLEADGLLNAHSKGLASESIVSANAYLGALPIKVALDEGAQIVITGRCVDSAVTLGILMHEFEWKCRDYDRLAQGSIAGHIIECGCQATGGLFTDWEAVPGWDKMGFPILECHENGDFVVTKPASTGGLVTPAAVAEQILYEVSDPTSYFLPDVTCDFSNVSLTQLGRDRVRVTGIKGREPTTTYKVSATYISGYKAVAQLTIIGFDAVQKAQRVGEAILGRTRRIFERKGLADYRDTLIEVLGGESAFGPHSAASRSREVVLRLAVRHSEKRALEIFAREIAPAGTTFCPGITGIVGRSKPTAVINQFTFLSSKSKFAARVVFEDFRQEVEIPRGDDSFRHCPKVAARQFDLPLADREPVVVPLIRIAYGRSGDKGDTCNIGLLARNDELVPYLYREVTADRVKSYLSHLVLGKVHRFEVPGINGLNLLCEDALGGGGMTSLRNDPWGKGMAQILLSMPITVPERFVRAADDAKQSVPL
jgi:hypothetical protein